MNPIQKYNFTPTTVEGNQFLSYRQPSAYMTDFRNNSDTYAYLINNSLQGGPMTGHDLRQYMQDNGTLLTDTFLKTSASQFINMELQGAPNTCSGSEQGVIYSGGAPLINELGQTQQFPQQCNVPGQSCMMVWKDTPLPQQGPHCQEKPKNYYSSYLLLN
jgi:hypothetical protein